jgi:hypothetical protein
LGKGFSDIATIGPAGCKPFQGWRGNG